MGEKNAEKYNLTPIILGFSELSGSSFFNGSLYSG
jgi:hypothetical protein